MGEPLSIASSAVALVTFALQSSVILYDTVRSFRSQDKDARALRDELGGLTNVLESLTDTITSNPSINFDTLKLPLHCCGRACKEYGELIERCTKHSTGSRPSVRDWVTQKYLQGDITDFKATLAGYKATINVALANANIRVTAITTTVLEEYKDLIADTRADLQDHLQRLEQQVQGLSTKKPSSDSADFEVTELHAMLEEKESTRLGLRICAQLSAQIEQLESTSTEGLQFSNRPSAHKHLKSGLNTTKTSIENVVTRLRSHEDDIDRQLESMSSATPISNDAIAQFARLQETKASIRQCIDIVSDASENLAQERRNVFENITLADNSYEFSVSTIGDLVTARQLDLSGRSRHIGGQISSQDYQMSIEALTRLDIEHIRATHPLDRYRPQANQNNQSNQSNQANQTNQTNQEGSDPETPAIETEHFRDQYGRGVRLAPSEEERSCHFLSPKGLD